MGEMRQAVMAAAGVCLMAALQEQLLEGGRFFAPVRMALGMQLAWAAVELAERALRALG